MNENNRRFPWPPAVLPLIEVVCLGAACSLLATHPIIATGLALMAAVALNFTVHVFFHECIHYSSEHRLPRVFNWVGSVILGMPLDGYRVHHCNHHQHDNGAEDFSTTWKHAADGSRTPWHRLAYVFGWPRQSLAAGRFLRQGVSQARDAEFAGRIPAQRNAILIGLVALALGSWTFALLYLAVIYLGWALVALQNYGQHMPSMGGEATTFTHPLYNRLLFNNGLHWEHHALPDRSWRELRLDARSPRIQVPHLLQPFVVTGVREGAHD